MSSRVVLALALARAPLFSGLDQSDLEEIVKAARPCRYPEGSVVFHEGDPGDALFLLKQGRVKIVLQNEAGREVILAVVEAPDVVGHLAVVDGAPRSATVIAMDPIDALRLAREPFVELLAKNRQLLERLLAQLARSLRETNEQVRTVLMYDIHGQILRALIKRGREQDKARIIVAPKPSHEEIGQMIGKARETVSRALGDLKESGHLDSDKRAFYLNRAKLGQYWHG